MREHRETPEIAAPIEAAKASNASLLVERVREAGDNIGQFLLRLGNVACFGRPQHGAHVEVQDIDGSYREMREHVLRPPFRRPAFPTHVTLIHPQTSHRGREFCDRGAYQQGVQEFIVREIAVTAFDGARWVVVEKYGLACEPRAAQKVSAQASSNFTMQRTAARDAHLGR